MKEIFLIDTIHPAFNEIIEQNDFRIRDVSALNRNDIMQLVAAAEGIVIRSRFPVDREFIDCAVNTRFIARAGAGMENIDVKYAKTKGIHCINAPEGNRDAVGEHALGMLLSLFNRINISDREVRAGIWRREANRGHELQGKTVAIIGFGNMGSSFAEKIRGLGVRIIAYDKYKTISKSEYPGIAQVDMDAVFLNADVLSLHIPLTEETDYLINTEYIQSFKKNIWLINTSRGRNVKTKDLADALQSGKVKGACLDVIEYEDTSFEKVKDSMPAEWHYLTASENVILTPHVAGWSFESHKKISEILAEKIIYIYKNNE